MKLRLGKVRLENFPKAAVIESILHHSRLEEQLKSYHMVLWFKWNF